MNKKKFIVVEHLLRENNMFLMTFQELNEKTEKANLNNEKATEILKTLENLGAIKILKNNGLENCYISSCGVIWGYYFPNDEITAFLNNGNSALECSFVCVVDGGAVVLKNNNYFYLEIKEYKKPDLLNYRKDDLKKHIEQCIIDYKIKLDILENLTFSKTKSGENFKDIKKAFNMNQLNEYLKNKYGYFKKCYLSLTDSDFKIDIALNISGCYYDGSLYLTRKKYLKDLKEEEKAETRKNKTIFGGGIQSEYYYIDTIEEIKKEIEEVKISIADFLQKEEAKSKKFNKLVKLCNNFLIELKENFSEYYISEIKDIL